MTKTLIAVFLLTAVAAGAQSWIDDPVKAAGMPNVAREMAPYASKIEAVPQYPTERTCDPLLSDPKTEVSWFLYRVKDNRSGEGEEVGAWQSYVFDEHLPDGTTEPDNSVNFYRFPQLRVNAADKTILFNGAVIGTYSVPTDGSSVCPIKLKGYVLVPRMVDGCTKLTIEKIVAAR